MSGIRDVRHARARHDGGDRVGGERRHHDVLVAGDEQDRAAGRRQLLRRAGPAGPQPRADAPPCRGGRSCRRCGGRAGAGAGCSAAMRAPAATWMPRFARSDAGALAVARPTLEARPLAARAMRPGSIVPVVAASTRPCSLPARRSAYSTAVQPPIDCATRRTSPSPQMLDQRRQVVGVVGGVRAARVSARTAQSRGARRLTQV